MDRNIGLIEPVADNVYTSIKMPTHRPRPFSSIRSADAAKNKGSRPFSSILHA